MTSSTQHLPTVVNRVDGPPPYGYGGSGAVERCSDVGEHILGAVQRTGHHLSGEIGHSTRDIVSAVHSTGANELEATRDIGMALQKGQCDTSMMLAKGVCDIEATITDDVKDFALSNIEHQRDILSAILAEGGRNARLTAKSAVKSQKKTVVESARTREQVREESYKQLLGQKELLLEGRDTREKLVDGQASAARRAARDKGDLMLQACQNTDAIKSAIEDCCCELKLEIADEADATRTLIQNNTIADLQGQISLLNIQLNLLGGGLAARNTGLMAQRS